MLIGLVTVAWILVLHGVADAAWSAGIVLAVTRSQRRAAAAPRWRRGHRAAARRDPPRRPVRTWSGRTPGAGSTRCAASTPRTSATRWRCCGCPRSPTSRCRAPAASSTRSPRRRPWTPTRSPGGTHAPAFVAAVERAERAWRAARDAAERIRLSNAHPRRARHRRAGDQAAHHGPRLRQRRRAPRRLHPRPLRAGEAGQGGRDPHAAARHGGPRRRRAGAPSPPDRAAAPCGPCARTAGSVSRRTDGATCSRAARRVRGRASDPVEPGRALLVADRLGRRARRGRRAR